jgi:uncharacterized protein (UPF0276 family)
MRSGGDRSGGAASEFASLLFEQEAVMTKSALPAKTGVGFKPEHFDGLTADPGPMGFIEVHAENYMGDGGLPHAQLTDLHQRFALSVHGVALSIGAEGPLDRAHLARLRRLCERYQPESFSEHLAWSSHGGAYLNDLLPLGRRMLLENPATYIVFAESTIAETDFLAEVVRRTGCGLLLDVNNVFVSSTNHGTSAAAYLAAFPLEHVGEVHLAGHAESVDDTGAPLLIDAHGSPVADPVWALFEQVIARAGPLPTLIEWDNDVPAWPVLRSEAVAAAAVLDRHRAKHAA